MLQNKMNILNIYNPGNLTKPELVKSYVVRLKEFNSIFEAIKDDPMKNPSQHYIIQGIRGSGKTTLLLRIYYALKDEEKLNQWLIPLISNEEQYSIRKLYKFWENIAIYLENEHNEFLGLYDEMQKFIEIENYEEKCYELLIEFLHNKKKKIVLLVDNFGPMLEKFSKSEHQRFREVLITNTDIKIIGASATVLEITYDYSKPFFDFFKIIDLNGLTQKETITLLLKLDEDNKEGTTKKIVKEQPGRIEALRRLTNGVPRTIVLLFEIFRDNQYGNSFKDLEFVLDRVTPLYKHRMDDLSAQQQEITDVIAMNWDAIGVKEIVKKTRMESKHVSSQLKQLEKNNIIIKKTTSTKNNLYQLKERFFNIWYLMRHGRKKDKRRVGFLVRFLEIWCDNEELIKRTKFYLEKIKQGKLYDKYVYYMSETYAQLVSSPVLQHELLQVTKKYLTSIESNFLSELSKSDIEIAEEVEKYYNKGEYDRALQKLTDIKSKTGIDHKATAIIYQFGLKDQKEAEKYYLMAIKKGNVDAMYNLALLYHTEHKDFNKAEKYYLMAIDKGHINAMNSLALLYHTEYKDFKKAEKYYLMAVDKGNTNAMNSLAWEYFIQMKNKMNALKYSKQSFEKDNNTLFSHTYTMVLLWHNEIEKAAEVSKFFMEQEESFEKFNTDIELFLLMLISKKQFNYTLKLFNKNKFNLTDRFKPIYYALMHFMQDIYPDEIKKMGNELKQTVDEIIAKIKQMEIDYA